ncbi:MAG: NAD-dependent epimerase/dehydratase family protein [Bacteroidetes bacterium]|nr:NAD-dependent epimerase/dehydratase family protein [Bacteroidota bacterium]MCL5026740.1 NAD-dependent epimerase/dehydratase family protein [Chloroflexota bacterium]
MKRALVTGATGFVGANLARRLLREGHEVHLLLRCGYAPWRIEAIRDDVRLHEVDLGDGEALAGLVAGIRPDWVFHLAAHGAYSSQTDLHQMVQTNFVGTLNLVEACLKAGFDAFVNTGSSSEYGFKDHAPSEEELIEPNSHYAVTKASATLFCRHAAQSRNAPLTTLRLYSVYGPFEEPTRLIPTLIMHGLSGGLPPLVNPSIVRDYVYVEDVSDAYLLAAGRAGRAPGAVYNVGTGTQTSLRQVVAMARRVMDIAAEPKWGSMPDRQWDTGTWVADNRRIVSELGWQPRYTLEHGFRATVGWFLDNPSMRDYYGARRKERAQT